MDPTPTAPLLQGWLMMAGLIVAIGAQNALVLRQGLLRQHVGAVVMFCTVSDVLLIAVGVHGLGGLLGRWPAGLEAMRWAGAAFVLLFGLQAARRAWRGTSGLAVAPGSAGRAGVLASAAAMTWLNPHVYLDTVVLLGSVGAQQPVGRQLPFAAGAALASAMWFAALGYGASALAGTLARPSTWRAIDALVAVVMAAVAAQLLAQPLAT